MITFLVFYSKIQQLKTDENWVNWHWKANHAHILLRVLPLQLHKKYIR